MKKSYDERLKGELAHYQQIFKNKFFQEVPPVWNEVEKRFAKQIEIKTGVTGLPEYIARHARGKKHLKLLSLGSGACGVELLTVAPLLTKQKTKLTLTSVDINDKVLSQARDLAKRQKVEFEAIAQDINKLRLKPKSYDVIMAYASLHHFEKLDRITKQINLALKRGGIFVTVDIPTRNGYLMWPETSTLVEKIWKVLPRRYRWDHTASTRPVWAPSYPDVDYSIGSFECSNSEEIIPSLRKNMKEVQYIPAFAFARRFFDTKFGPNYRLNRPLDRALFEVLMTLDELLVGSGALRPETFFGVYAKRG